MRPSPSLLCFFGESAREEEDVCVTTSDVGEDLVSSRLPRTDVSGETGGHKVLPYENGGECGSEFR